METNEKQSSKAMPQLDFGSILPIGTAILVFLGVCKLLFFYNLFGINIISFLQFTEILTSFLDTLVIVVIFIFVFVFQVTMTLGKKDTRLTELTEENVYKDKGLGKRLWIHLKSRLGFIFTVFATLITPLFFEKNSGHEWSLINILFGVTVMYFLMFIATELKRYAYFNREFEKTLSYGFSIFFILSLIGIVFVTAYRDSIEIKEKKSTFGTQFILNDERCFISDSNNYYIGKTENYLFFYHQNERKTDVFPMNSVKEITFCQH